MSTTPEQSPLTIEQLRAVPKVALHDHLDGGLRPQTVIDHCLENGHEPPVRDAAQLADWMYDRANSGSLVEYLTTFDHTIAAMQTAAQLTRVAREFVLDQSADGVVYAEARWAPEQHTKGGLSMAQAIEAVRDGLAAGQAEVRAQGRFMVAQQIVTSMRHGEPSLEVAELAVAYRDQGVCGFDIAGAEKGFPPSRLAAAFDYLKRQNFHFTIHAGEAFGLPSIWEAVQICGAQRLGHGVRIVDDIAQDDSGRWHLGELAGWIRDMRIPLELCPSSNLQTGIADRIEDHPIDLLAQLRFRVTVNCDNRLMSRTTLSREFALLSQAFGWTMADVRWATINAAKSAFYRFDERLAMIDDVIKPGFAAALGEQA